MLCLLSYVRAKKPPAGVEPAPRPYKGRVLAVDTTEALMETVGVEPTPPRCKRGALPIELHPQVRTGGVESRYAQRYTRVYSAGSSNAQRPRERRAIVRIRTGTTRITTSDAAVTPRPPCRRCQLRRRRLITVWSAPKSNAGKSSLPASGPDFPAESGDDRTRTGACSPDKRVLSAAELRPQMK